MAAAALAAVNPFLIYYSQETRMYALLAFCAVITVYALVRWLAAGRPGGERVKDTNLRLARDSVLHVCCPWPLYALRLPHPFARPQPVVS